MSLAPFTYALTHQAVRNRQPFCRLPRRLRPPFRFCCDEWSFARELLERSTQLWLFRSNQRRFCGDFVVVDMSASRPERRRAWLVDLKLGAPLRVGGGGAGVSFRNGPRAVGEIARTTGAIRADMEPARITGDRRAVLALLT